MHSRNPYKDRPPNFSELADAFPELRPFITLSAKGGPTIDFKNADALRALTRALLQRDFRLTIDLPQDRLCPAIPGRLDYCLCMQDVYQAHRKNLALAGSAEAGELVGLDIGTGAAAIYPLLFSRIEPNINMIGTDIDEESLASADASVGLCQLDHRISILRTTPEAHFFRAALDIVPHFDFTMCNPPFYSSAEEMQQLADDKDFAPNAVCTGSPNEMVYAAGGEVAFVARMIDDSQTVGDSILWFSSLLGKGSTVISTVQHLQKLGCSNYATIELLQGQTQRWVVTWSWQAYRLPDSVARQLPQGPLSKSLPLPNTLIYVCPISLALADASELLRSDLADLDLQYQEQTEGLLVTASHVSWTRAARRAKLRGLPGMADKTDLICQVVLQERSNPDLMHNPCEFTCSWIRGTDRQHFESLFSHLVRKLATRAQDGIQESEK